MHRGVVTPTPLLRHRPAGSARPGGCPQVAGYVGTVHHEFYSTVQEGFDALKDVIYHLETYDVTTVRASTPMYLMARRIRAMGIEMLLSGEGADEVFGVHLYFHKAPNPREFHEETAEGRVSPSCHLRGALPPAGSGHDRSRWEVGGVQHPGGTGVGRCIPGHERTVGPCGARRAPPGVLTRRRPVVPSTTIPPGRPGSTPGWRSRP